MQRVEDGGKREIPSENIIQQTDELYDAHVGFVLILSSGILGGSGGIAIAECALRLL